MMLRTVGENDEERFTNCPNPTATAQLTAVAERYDYFIGTLVKMDNTQFHNL